MKMKKKLISLMLIVLLSINLLPNLELRAASYEVKTYQAYVTTVVGHAAYDLFYFYKNGERICTPKSVRYKSSNSKVVEVEDNSDVAFFRGKKTGKATITCTYKGTSASIVVYVKKMSAAVNGWKNVTIPQGSSVYMEVDPYENKNIGTISLSSSNSGVVKLEKKKIEPFDCFGSFSYSGSEITASKVGTTTVTVKSKVSTEKLKITVVPKLTIKISNVTRKETKGGYNFSCKITNQSAVTIKAGGPIQVGVYRGFYTAAMNEEEVNLKKGESATFTFFVPLESEEGFVDDAITNVYVQYKGYCLSGYVEDNGMLTIGSFAGKVPFNATIDEYYL